MRVWLIEASAPPKVGDKFAGLRGASDGAEGAISSRARRRQQAKAAQRGEAYDRLLGMRRAQLYAAHLDVRLFQSSADCLEAVRADGRVLWATDLSQAALPLTSDAAALGATLPPRLAVVVGSEGAGVSEAMLAAAERRIFLPMYGFTESFNVSVASALVLQRLLDASQGDRGRLPPEEMTSLRRTW
jgi:tRNA(Leu) C34 or U34 (ribose-2'-O)-methylase TrmL